MKKLGIYVSSILILTILMPTLIVKTFKFVPRGNIAQGEQLDKVEVSEEKEKSEEPIEIIESPFKESYKYENIIVYNTKTSKAETINMEDYVKGVVAAEMPAAFHIEALKAQAVAARTYAISRTIKHAEGHKDHPEAPICTGVHCQAYLSLSELNQIHGDSWVVDYWPKIEDAVIQTNHLGIFYNGEIIEPMYHSTSGGKTENVQDVFSVELPYLKSVSSPYEEASPKYRNKITITTDEFISKVKSKYPSVNITKDNISEKIKLIERTMSGRVKKIALDKTVIEGRDLRDLFGLNSTNFTIVLQKKLNIIEIETYGFGHGVGMSQWGANGMGKNGSTFEEILKHYYSGIEIKELE